MAKLYGLIRNENEPCNYSTTEKERKEKEMKYREKRSWVSPEF